MKCEEIKPPPVLDRLETMGGMRLFGRTASSAHKVRESPTSVMLLPAQLLKVGELLAISDGVATTLRIDLGEVWITEEGSFIDHILCAGQRYTIDRPGRAIVAARTVSRIALCSPIFGVPPKRVERCNPRLGTNEVLYARSLLLNAAASLIPLWARQPAVVEPPLEISDHTVPEAES